VRAVPLTVLVPSSSGYSHWQLRLRLWHRPRARNRGGPDVFYRDVVSLDQTMGPGPFSARSRRHLEPAGCADRQPLCLGGRERVRRTVPRAHPG